MEALDRLERLVTEGTATRAESLIPFARGGLAEATELISPARSVAVITGFPVSTDQGQTPETDGPIGSAALASFLSVIGRTSVVVTDDVNGAACEAALEAYTTAHGSSVELHVAGADLGATSDRLRELAVDLLIYVERPGPNASGRYMSMRGTELHHDLRPLDQLLEGGTPSIGIGDGGNEVGMGGLPVAAMLEIAHGEEIRCVTATDALIVAGTSNWGAWALIGAVALQSGEWLDEARRHLDPDDFMACLRSVLRVGAVDGVTSLPTETVDGIDAATHRMVLAGISASMG